MEATDIQTAVEKNLSLVAYLLERKWPEFAPILVIGTGQGDRMVNAELSTLLLDYGGSIAFQGPVIREAYRLLVRMGYRIHFYQGEAITDTLSGRAEQVSQHERLMSMVTFN